MQKYIILTVINKMYCLYIIRPLVYNPNDFVSNKNINVFTNKNFIIDVRH